MGTAVGRAAADVQYYTRGHYIPGIKVTNNQSLSAFTFH